MEESSETVPLAMYFRGSLTDVVYKKASLSGNF